MAKSLKRVGKLLASTILRKPKVEPEVIHSVFVEKAGIVGSAEFVIDGPITLHGFEFAPDNSKLADGQRGAVVADPVYQVAVNQDENSPATLSEPADPQFIARALLFFDRIDYLDFGAAGIKRPREGDRLEIDGVTLRRAVHSMGGRNTSLYDLAYFGWLDRERTEPGRWSLWCEPGVEPVSESDRLPSLGVQLRLQNALLFPHHDVPVEDILSFKEQRRSELDALRFHLAEVASEISNAEPGSFQQVLRYEKFERSLLDYSRAIQERNWRKTLVDLNVTMNWGVAMRAALASGGVVGSATMMAAPLLAAASAVGVGLAAGIEAGTTYGAKSASTTSPFAYLAQIKREL